MKIRSFINADCVKPHEQPPPGLPAGVHASIWFCTLKKSDRTVLAAFICPSLFFSFFCDSRFRLFIRFFLLQYHISHTGQHIFWHDYDYHTIQYFMSSCDIMRHTLLKSSHVSSIIYPKLFSSFEFYFLGERCDVTEWEAENMSNQRISNWFGWSCCKNPEAVCFINTHQFQHVLFHWRSRRRRLLEEKPSSPSSHLPI